MDSKKKLHIPIGPTCNNYCIFCKESDREHRKELNSKYTPEVISDILYKYKGKLDKVVFTSGEPTLNPKLLITYQTGDLSTIIKIL